MKGLQCWKPVITLARLVTVSYNPIESTQRLSFLEQFGSYSSSTPIPSLIRATGSVLQMAIVNRSSRSASVMTTLVSDMLLLAAEDIERLCIDFPSVRLKLEYLASRRVQVVICVASVYASIMPSRCRQCRHCRTVPRHDPYFARTAVREPLLQP